MKKKIKRRRLPIGAQFRSPQENVRPKKRRLLAADRRQQERENAEKRLTLLAGKLANIKAKLKENLAKGRYAYKASLADIYRLAWNWEREGIFEKRIKDVAALSGRLHRSGANPFSALVAAITERNGKTISRWSQQLNDAFEQEISPEKLMKHLESYVR